MIFIEKIPRIFLLSIFGVWFVYQTIHDLSYYWEVSALLTIDFAGLLVYIWTFIKDRKEYTLSQSAMSFLPTSIGMFFVLVSIAVSSYQSILKQNRFDTLISNYYSRPYDTNFVKTIIPSNDTNINGRSQYQCLIDSSNTKFIAFYLENSGQQDIQSLLEHKTDKNFIISTDKDIGDPEYLIDTPSTYAYIVKGVKHSDTWYYQKSNVTYFDANSVEEGRKWFFNLLQGWGFFRENSTDFNPNFWKTHHFQRIKDLRKDPDWSTYGETVWKDKERKDRDYIGLYAIVAEELRRKKKEKYDAFDSLVSKTIFIPFYELQIKTNPAIFAKYSVMYGKPTLIYSEKMDIVINPVVITGSNGRRSLHFYLSFVDTRAIYEWTYFRPKVLRENEWHYGSDILDQLSTITEWDFSYMTLDDKTFWDSYVLTKEGDNFRYLKQLK